MPEWNDASFNTPYASRSCVVTPIAGLLEVSVHAGATRISVTLASLDGLGAIANYPRLFGL